MNIPRSVNRATNGLFNSTKPFTAPAAAHLRLLALIAVCLMAGNLVLADNTVNTVTIGGSGRQSANINTSGSSSSVIDLYQVGTLTEGAENQAGITGNPITQTGTGHTVRIGQGATYDNNKNAWVPGSAVQNNIAKVNQSGASGDNAAIYQTTSNNTADVTQTGSSQQVTVTQSDSTGNSATISQTGAGQVASITQNGSASSTMSAVLTGAIPLTVTQIGAGGHTATLDASGGSLLSVNQEGTSNKATVTGMTGGSATINQTGVRGELTLSEQSGGSLSVSQSGSNSALGINASGFSSSLSVTQTGNGGTTSFNPVTLPSGISITSTPPKNP
jgi:hypothetical protein